LISVVIDNTEPRRLAAGIDAENPHP
jgi:hypothetical protein